MVIPRLSPRVTVYPRVGGETPETRDADDVLAGLSPRGRGNLERVGVQVLHEGSIPAWAGKPSIRRAAATSERVYPRVGGETHTTISRNLGGEGLSPRGRGNHRG